MKSYILLLLLLIGATVCRGQSGGGDSIASRMVGATYYLATDSSYKLQDSAVLTFTGTHGGTDRQPWGYSTYERYVYTNSNGYHKQWLSTQVFGANDSVSTRTEQYWYDKNGDVNVRRYNYLYDSNNKLICLIQQEWDSTTTGGQWVNTGKTIFVYNANNAEAYSKSYFWDTKKSYWFLSSEEINYYNKYHLLFYNKTYEWYGKHRVVGDYGTELHFYNSNRQESLLLEGHCEHKIFSDTVSRTVTIYSKQNDKDSIQTVQQWKQDIPHWRDDSRHRYLYDTSGNVSSDIKEVWDTTKQTWVKVNEVVSTYNKFHQQVVIVNNMYNQNAKSKAYYYYEPYHLKKKKSK